MVRRVATVVVMVAVGVTTATVAVATVAVATAAVAMVAVAMAGVAGEQSYDSRSRRNRCPQRRLSTPNQGRHPHRRRCWR